MATMRAGFLRGTYFVEYAVSIENRPDRLCVAVAPCQTLVAHPEGNVFSLGRLLPELLHVEPLQAFANFRSRL